MTPHEILSKRITGLHGSPKHVGDIEAALALSEIRDAGFAIVPLEPTEAMVDAGVAAKGDCETMWTAMLAASQDKETG